MVYVHDLSPYIFRIGDGFGLRWYGVAYVLGFVLGIAALRRAARAGKLGALQESDLEPLFWAIVIGVVVGGRIGFVLQHLDQLARDPLFLFRVYEGGMAFFGGLAGVVLALVWFSRRKRVPFAKLGDVVTVPAALSLGFGRITNFINGELHGIPTNAGWGVIYPHVDNQPRHPSELYEAASHFLLALAIWLFGRTAAGQTPGARSALFVLVYGLLRTVTERFRTADTYVGPLTNGQVASLVVAAVGAIALYLVLRKEPAKQNTVGTPSDI